MTDQFALATDFSSDRRLLAVAGDKGKLGLWDASTLAPVRALQGLRGWTQAVACSRDGRRAARDTATTPAAIWDVGSAGRPRSRATSSAS